METKVEYKDLLSDLKGLIIEESIIVCEEFMKQNNLNNLLIVGGSVLKNNLKTKPIDDYDIKIIGNAESLKTLVTKLIESGWVSLSKEVFIPGSSSKNSIHSFLRSPDGKIFDIGFRESSNQTQKTPFVAESLIIRLENTRCMSSIKREIMDVKPL